jgi:hypothetical protein
VSDDVGHDVVRRAFKSRHLACLYWRARGITFHKTSGVQDFPEKSKTSKLHERGVIFSDDVGDDVARHPVKNRRLACTRHHFSQNERRARFS